MPSSARVVQPDGLGLDGDAALALQIHLVQQLILHFPVRSAPVYSRSRSARVDLPWSIWAMMEKLRSLLIAINPLVMHTKMEL